MPGRDRLGDGHPARRPLLGVALHLLLSRDLHRQLDSDLRRRAAGVATLCVSAPALLTSPGALDSSSNGVGLDVEVVDRTGAILSRSLALGARSCPRRPSPPT